MESKVKLCIHVVWSGLKARSVSALVRSGPGLSEVIICINTV